nr:hypothetical protein [uncultured Methanoregula sp.]
MKIFNLIAFLVVLLQISTGFIPRVSAAETKQEMAKVAGKKI